MQHLSVQDAAPVPKRKSQRAYHAIDADLPSTPSPMPQQPVMEQQPQQLGQQGNIAQPVHSQGQQLQGQRVKLDVDAIPSPVTVHWHDQQRVDNEMGGAFLSCARAQVPLSMVDYVAVDQGEPMIS